MGGGILGANNVPSTAIAGGIWRLGEQYEAIRVSNWPVASEITYIGGTTSSDSSTITLPAGLQQHDIVFIFEARDTSTLTTPTGYTSISLTGTSNPSTSLAYKIMGATPDTTAAVTNSSDTCSLAVAFRGVDTTTPLDVTPTTSTGISGVPNSPSITPTNNNCMIVAFGALDDDVVTATGLTGYTLGPVINNGTAGTTTSIMSGYLLQETAAAEDPPAFTASGDDRWEAYTVALRRG